MSKQTIIQKIKKRLPKNVRVTIDGSYTDGKGNTKIWWSVSKDDGLVWVECEDDTAMHHYLINVTNLTEEELSSIFEALNKN